MTTEQEAKDEINYEDVIKQKDDEIFALKNQITQIINLNNTLIDTMNNLNLQNVQIQNQSKEILKLREALAYKK